MPYTQTDVEFAKTQLRLASMRYMQFQKKMKHCCFRFMAQDASYTLRHMKRDMQRAENTLTKVETALAEQQLAPSITPIIVQAHMVVRQKSKKDKQKLLKPPASTLRTANNAKNASNAKRFITQTKATV
ncbi:hypothetical protein OAM67_01865 [bacterium]|nr:hypothetical protein [bacterium]